MPTGDYSMPSKVGYFQYQFRNNIHWNPRKQSGKLLSMICFSLPIRWKKDHVGHHESIRDASHASSSPRSFYALRSTTGQCIFLTFFRWIFAPSRRSVMVSLSECIHEMIPFTCQAKYLFHWPATFTLHHGLKLWCINYRAASTFQFLNSSPCR